MRSFGRSKGGGRRGQSREFTPLTAVFTTADRSNSAELIDFSATGARLRGDDLPEPGDELRLSIDSLQLFGVAAWVRADECGIAFDHTLGPDEVKSVRERIKPRIRILGLKWR